jgi:hypothetical protein
LWAQWTAVATTQTSLPTIGSMSCICDFDGTAVIVTVTNNDSSSATVYAAGNSSFSGQQSAFVSSGGSATPINIAPRSLSVNMFIYLGF